MTLRSKSLVIDLIYLVAKHKSGKLRCPATALIIAPAYSRVRYRSPNFCQFVRPFIRPSTFTSKFGFLNINDSCEYSNCIVIVLDIPAPSSTHLDPLTLTHISRSTDFDKFYVEVWFSRHR